MSRHRAVRNLDLDEELADDYGDDYDVLGMYPWASKPNPKSRRPVSRASRGYGRGTSESHANAWQPRRVWCEGAEDERGTVGLLLRRTRGYQRTHRGKATRRSTSP